MRKAQKLNFFFFFLILIFCILSIYSEQGRFQDFRQGGVKKYFARRAKKNFLPPPILILPLPILILPPSL
jgi:hypothetical protein